MNLDITFCNDGYCKIEDCKRHQKHLKDVEIGNRPISVSDFPYCDYHSEQFIERLMKKRNSKNDTDKDIEIVKSIVKVHNDFNKGCNKETISEKEIQAISNVLSKLEIYKKIVYYLGKEYNCTGKIEKFKDVLGWSEEWKRKEVEKNGRRNL